MKYALNLDHDGRILSVCDAKYMPDAETVVDSFPSGNILDYKYENGEFVYSPLPEEAEQPSEMEKLEAQVMFTALMTDTLIEGE